MKKIFKKVKNTNLKFLSWFKKQSLTKKIIIIILLIAGFFVVSKIITNLTKPAPYTLERVEKTDIVETVTESGNVISSGRIDVYSPTNGIVTESYVKNGMHVEKGDKLYVVKSSATEQERRQAQANYLAAVNALNTANATANTLRAAMYGEWKSFTDIATDPVYESGGKPNLENRKAAEFQIAQDKWLAAEKAYKDQQTVIAQANAAVASTYALYMATQDATVTAPVSGTVANLAITNGSTVSIKSVNITGSLSTPSLIIMSDHKPEILLELSETDITKVEPGQEASIEITAVSNKKYRGLVDRVDSLGTDNQGVVTYKIYVTILDADNNIRQGMSTDVEITTKKLKNVLSVSNSAVKPYKGGRAVRVPDSKKPEKFRYIPVIVGVRGSDKTQILKGLSEGQEIITSLSNENIQRPGLFGN